MCQSYAFSVIDGSVSSHQHPLWSVQQGYAKKRQTVHTDGLMAAVMTCPDREQPAGLSVSQVSSSDRRTIVDTWIECVAAHDHLHVTFSECHKKTTFLTAKMLILYMLFQGGGGLIGFINNYCNVFLLEI